MMFDSILGMVGRLRGQVGDQKRRDRGYARIRQP
jgi:hypothetical protein